MKAVGEFAREWLEHPGAREFATQLDKKEIPAECEKLLRAACDSLDPIVKSIALKIQLLREISKMLRGKDEGSDRKTS